MKKGILFVISSLFFVLCAQAQVAVTGVNLNSTNETLGKGEKFQLIPTIVPNNATTQSVEWTTTNPNVVTVSTTGLITALNTGTAKIIVETRDGGFKDTCDVTVIIIPVTGVSLDKKTLRLKCGTCYQLKATVAPLNATDKTVSFTSKNDYIADVKPNGLIWAGDPDTTLVIVETNDGSFKDTCVVIVEEEYSAVKSVSLDKETLTLIEGETIYLNETVLPKNVANKKVNWNSEDLAVATVSVHGLVTATNVGTTKISVKTVDGGKTASCLVNVISKDFIAVNPETATGENKTINFSIITPKNISLTGSFIVKFPKGISLNENTTKLSTEFEAGSSLTITNNGDNSWQIEIKEKTPVLHADTNQYIMDIGYTTDESVSNGEYDISFSQINFKLNDGSELKKDLVTLKVHIDDTANDDVINTNDNHAYLINNRLYIQSAQAESIYIYSLNGTLLLTKEKTTGNVAYDINLQEPVMIVKGSSGWTKKIAK